MEKELLIVSTIMMFIMGGSLVYSLMLISDCKKIIKSMLRRSRKYMKEVVK